MNSSTRNKPPDSLMSPYKPSSIGKELESSLPSGRKEDIEDTENQISSLEALLLDQQQKLQTLKDAGSATVVSRLLPSVKIWKDKLSTSEIDILTTKLSQTLDRESTLKEKDLTPFWTSQSEEISKSLWLPTKIDCVGSVLSVMKE